MNWIFKLLFKLSGWKISGSLPDLNKYIVAVAPHTSNWDFVIGVMARSQLKLTKARFLGKKELFDGPFGWLFRGLGGTPVDRHSKTDMVSQVVEQFNKHKEFILAIAPEGTRKKVEKLKTGFYHMAKGAGVPILPTGLDFASKTLVIGPLLFPGINMEEDLEKLVAFYRTIRGKNPAFGL